MQVSRLNLDNHISLWVNARAPPADQALDITLIVEVSQLVGRIPCLRHIYRHRQAADAIQLCPCGPRKCLLKRA